MFYRQLMGFFTLKKARNLCLPSIKLNILREWANEDLKATQLYIQSRYQQRLSLVSMVRVVGMIGRSPVGFLATSLISLRHRESPSLRITSSDRFSSTRFGKAYLACLSLPCSTSIVAIIQPQHKLLPFQPFPLAFPIFQLPLDDLAIALDALPPYLIYTFTLCPHQLCNDRDQLILDEPNGFSTFVHLTT
jgi:hypothetical protein